MKLRLGLIILFLPLISIYAQEAGCTDPIALNFNPLAEFNNGSCQYASTTYKPQLLFELPFQVRETSGLVSYNNLLWTHNDSKHKAELYALSPEDGKILKTIRVANAVNIDWEEISRDEHHLYIGDIGNNSGNRRVFQIYKLPLSLLDLDSEADVFADTINFSYPDQPEKSAYLNHNYDCEAFVVSGDWIYLFTKNWADGRTNLYRVPASKGVWQAEYVDSFDVNGLITGADYQPETNQLVLVGYTNRTWLPYMWIMFDFRGNDFFSGNKRRINFTRLVTNQIEAVAFTEPGKVVITSERSKTAAARAFAINTVNWVYSMLLNLPADDESCNSKFEFVPTDNGYLLSFKSKRSDSFVVELFDTNSQRIFHQAYSQNEKRKTFFLETGHDLKTAETLIIYNKKHIVRCQIR